MSLEVYKKKRDFRRTPEPVSSAKEKKIKLSFVVQRHDASRLHYDFRLEMEGVLKSWAVPKGPSMVAGEKRLAIMVEDHPLDYGGFYGEIPEGNYGAGTVEIFDKGTYEPAIEKGDPEKNLLEMLEKGDIKFTLKGKYLKGRFAIFHLKNREKPNEWMIVKKADEYAVDEFDIESIQPLKSKIRPARAKAKKENPPEPFPDPLPEPMLAKLVKEVMDNPSWIYEPKLDGYRVLCRVRQKKPDLISRNGGNFTSKYTALLADLSDIEEDVILDGEVVVERPDRLTDFQLLQNYSTTQKGNLKYYVFDILYLNGHNLMSFPLLKRKELLEAFFNKYSFKKVFNLEFRTGDGKKFFDELSSRGYEGMIAKDPESTYNPGKRGESWLKIKAMHMQEAVICGYTMPQKSRKYFGSLIMGLHENGELKYVGNCGTGFNDVSLKELFMRFELLKTSTCPFKRVPKLTGAKGKPVWIKPELVANIKFLEWTGDGIMRSPVFMGLREDKDAAEVINEETSENVDIPGESGTSGTASEFSETEKEKTIVVSGKRVKCTNLTKVYWPGEGYTKADLIDYYLRISKYILPYLKDRPQSLNRFPNGISGESFYQKDMDVEQVPSWVKTVKMESKTNSEGIDYMICNDAATLVYMANLGCIEINPWHSTYKKPENPTYLMLDLDPGNIAFVDVVNTALVVKELCDEIKIPCYCKTSGATGLHIYIPLEAKYNYDQAKTFAELLAGIAHSRLPSTTSIERVVAKRKDKVYVDFLQNRKSQTIAAPYSVRPRPYATVSTPLDWKEVNHQLNPEAFTIVNIEKRLEKVGDLWTPVLEKGISINNALKEIEKLS
jgi:bifunctional non-homologous end joining protein LigD